MESRTQQRNNSPKELNDVRIGMGSIVGKVIGYCNVLLTEKQIRTIKFTAVGGAIGKLINVVENLRIFHSGLYQSNVLSTVSYQAVDKQGKVINERLHPKMEVHLSLDEPAEKHEGFQTKLNEEERTKLHDFMNKRREERQAEGPRRGGRGQRGQFRGENRGRGQYRGEIRGRGQYRGENRGRGQFRGPARGGERGQRGQFRGPARGQFRGGNRGRGQFRGQRGGDRGARRF